MSGRPARINGCSPRTAADAALRSSCWLVGRRIPILRTSSVMRNRLTAPEYRADVLRRSSIRPPDTVIAFDAAYLDLPLVQNERTLKEISSHGAREASCSNTRTSAA